MKDDRGLYYYPNPQHKRVRMYVRLAADGQVEFRMFDADEPTVWERHGWMPMDAVRQAAAMYKASGRDVDPLALYDEAVARAVLGEEGKL